MIQVPLCRGLMLNPPPQTNTEVKHRPPNSVQYWIRYHWLNGGHSVDLVCGWRRRSSWEFGLPVENRIISTNRCAETGPSHTLSTQVWEMHPFCQMSSYSPCILFLCVCLCGLVHSGCRVNLGFCHWDPNGQHLPLWHSFFF